MVYNLKFPTPNIFHSLCHFGCNSSTSLLSVTYISGYPVIKSSTVEFGAALSLSLSLPALFINIYF
jgi:hypothetical protein